MPLRRVPVLAPLLLILLAGCSELLSDGFDYGSVEVQVVQRSGEPAPGVKLILYTWSHHMAYGESDAEGRHTFEFVPPGSYGVRAVPEEPFVTFTGFASVARDGVAMEKGGHEEVTFTLLKRGPGTVRVRVRDASGNAVPGTEVFLYAHFGGIADGVTGPTGEHVFEEVPFGDYGVRIEPTPGYVAAPGRGTSFLDGIVVDEGSVDVLEFAVERCTGRIRVRVADRSGSPVAGVRLSLYSFRGGISTAVTDEGGRAEFPEAPCGNLGVALQEALGYTFPPGRGAAFVDGLEIGNGTEREVLFEVTPCTGRIRARVVDVAGAPVPGARLVLYASSGELAEGETGAAGEFAFDTAPCGELGVKVEPPSGWGVAQGRGSSFFDALVVESGSERSVEFVLTRS